MKIFGKKSEQAFAVVLENGREIGDLAIKKMSPRREYHDEPTVDIAVRVEANDEPSFEAKMKTGISLTFLLLKGVRVQVKYDPNHKGEVTIDDNHQAILARNPQLIKKD